MRQISSVFGQMWASSIKASFSGARLSNQVCHLQTGEKVLKRAQINTNYQLFLRKIKGLAAQSKAEAIGWNKISSANQRPGFQMIFYTCQSARHMIMQLWFAV